MSAPRRGRWPIKPAWFPRDDVKRLSPQTKLARRIARALFTNGAKQLARRLVLELPDGTDGGGWSERAAADQIERVLARAGRAPGRG